MQRHARFSSHIGFRDEKNEPAGFDVDYCKDLAASLGVKPVVVETPWADRVPSLISNRADVSIAAASDTLERAQTVGLSIPYMAYVYQIAVRKGSDIKTFDDLKGRKVATVVSTTNESFFLEAFKRWSDPKGEHLSLQSEADMFLALQQGRVDAIVSGSTAVATNCNPGSSYTTSLRYLDLFVNRQVRSGRYKELHGKWVGGAAPDLTISGVYR